MFFFYRAKRRLSRLLSRSTPWIGTSISDDEEYPYFCYKASTQPKYFKIFRRHPAYTKILEHATYEAGRRHLAYIAQHHPRMLERLDELKKNDAVGSPVLYPYEGVGGGGGISPTTLGYMRVAADIEAKFGSLDGKDICEIGVGYGGLCRVLCALFSIRSYTLIDLPKVLGLAREYLNQFAVSARLEYKTMGELDPGRAYGLFISNYAFSEIRKSVQEAYYEKTIKNSEHGYILFNDIHGYDMERLSAEEYKQRIPALTISDEWADVSGVHDRNRLMYW